MEQQIFINEIQTSFVLRQPKSTKPTNIYLVCRIQGKQVKLATGVKVYPEHWNTKKQEAYISVRLTELDNQNNEIANKKIKALRDSVSSYKEYLCDNPDKITNSLNILREYIYKDYKHINRISKMKQQISATLEMKQLIDRQSTKESTKKGNIGAIGYLETFLKASKIDNTWNNINLETLEQFKQYYINKKTNATTINAYIKRILAVCRIANKSSKIQFSFEGNNLHLLELIKDNTNKTKRKNKQVALTEEQVMSLYSYTPKGRKATDLEEIRDIFILQCLVGQRISDMPKFFNGDYKYDSKTNTITITQQKTNEMAIIPLLPLAREILNKYNNNKMIVDINTIKDFRMNKDIKRIAEAVGLNEPIEYQEQKGTDILNITKPLHQMIHSHTARHTFVTIMCRMGIPKDVVIIATGHEDTTMIDAVYEHLNEQDKANKVHSAFNKLDGKLFKMDQVDTPIIAKDENKPPKPKTNILDYLFAEATLLRLDQLHSRDVNIYELPDISKAIRVIKDLSTISKAQSFLNGIDKTILYGRINKISEILWYIGKHYADATLYQLYEQKVIELGLSDSINQITSENILHHLWQQEISNEELD